MKKVLIFTGLKIAEIIGVIIVLFGVSKFGLWASYVIDGDIDIPNVFVRHLCGAWLGICILVAIALTLSLIGFGIYQLIKSNWKLADKLSK